MDVESGARPVSSLTAPELAVRGNPKSVLNTWFWYLSIVFFSPSYMFNISDPYNIRGTQYVSQIVARMGGESLLIFAPDAVRL